MTEVAVITAVIRLASARLIGSQIIATNKPTPSFVQAGCPSCRLTDSIKALKERTIIFDGTAHSKLTWGSSILFVCLFAWDVTALSAQIGYIAP